MSTHARYLVHINGQDKPGITATLMRILKEHEATLLDIEQTIVYGYLSLHVVIQMNSKADTLEASLSKHLGSKVKIELEPAIGKLHLADPSLRFVTTIIANNVTPIFIEEITNVIASFKANIDTIRKLNNGGLETIELVCSSHKNLQLSEISEQLLAISGKYPDVDLAVQRENLYRRSKRLVCFDMDSTLTNGEVIDELADRIGCKEEMEKITKLTMEGKLEFTESLRKRVKLLAGLTQEDLKAVADKQTLTPGSNTVIKVLKKLGFKIALFSGGFNFFTDKLKEDLGLHYAIANKLEFIDGICTGNIEGVIVDAQKKADLLELLAQQENILLDQVIAIGDGANDLLMLKKAGLGIAFNAKPITRANADTTITKKGMTSLLYFLGITDQEVKDMGFDVSTKLHSKQ